MKNKWRIAWMLIMALFLVSSVTGWASGASPLEQVLAQVPQEAFDTGFFSYADLKGLTALVPGVALPAEGQMAEDYLRSDSGSAFIRAMSGVSAGYGELIQTLFQLDMVKDATGLSVLKVEQTAEVGKQPQRLVVLRGGFDTQAVQQALAAKGYQASTEQQGLWCPDGDCALGAKVDLAGRDPGFLFGGLLGARWPVYFGKGVLMASPSEGAIRAASQRRPNLLEDEVVSAAVTAIGEDLGQVHQLLLLDPAKVLDGTRAGSSWSGIGMLAMAQVDGADAQRVVITISYDDGAQAEAARAALDVGVPDVVLAGGQPLPFLVEDLGGEWEDASVTQTGTGAVLRIPLRFPEQREALAADGRMSPGLPFSFFTKMVIQLDLHWLAELGS